MLPIRTVLHPTDFSEHSGYAFRLACSLARDYGARLIVLHVLERPLLVYTGVMTAPPPPPPSAEQRQSAREQLHGIKPPDPAIGVEHLLEEGDPATAILQVAQERPCELIVMGSHGRTGLGRLLMGSVAEQVVRRAPCPVLTVRIPEGQVPPSEAPAPAAADRGDVETATERR
jgi:nucleotide-binding universal stress UspA family protein